MDATEDFRNRHRRFFEERRREQSLEDAICIGAHIVAIAGLIILATFIVN